jgi:hypothetical protein
MVMKMKTQSLLFDKTYIFLFLGKFVYTPKVEILTKMISSKSLFLSSTIYHAMLLTRSRLLINRETKNIHIVQAITLQGNKGGV